MTRPSQRNVLFWPPLHGHFFEYQETYGRGRRSMRDLWTAIKLIITKVHLFRFSCPTRPYQNIKQHWENKIYTWLILFENFVEFHMILAIGRKSRIKHFFHRFSTYNMANNTKPDPKNTSESKIKNNGLFGFEIEGTEPKESTRKMRGTDRIGKNFVF